VEARVTAQVEPLAAVASRDSARLDGLEASAAEAARVKAEGIAALSARLAAVEAEHGVLEARQAEALSSVIAEAEGRAAGRLESMDELVDGIDAAVANMSGRVESESALLAGFAGRMDGLVADVDAVLARCGALEGGVAELRIGAEDIAERQGIAAFELRAAVAETQEQVRVALAEISEVSVRAAAHPGRFPIANAWSDAVHYDGEVVVHRGATWQARRDTGREPPHADWICLAAPGTDGRGFVVRGTWQESGTYDEHDIVALNGSSFVARRDAPGPCPGEGWQLWASRGGAGKATVTKGDRGKDGVEPVALTADDDGVLTLTLSDGRTFSADLYPLLARVAE
jgi:hypothetical protein